MPDANFAETAIQILKLANTIEDVNIRAAALVAAMLVTAGAIATATGADPSAVNAQFAALIAEGGGPDLQAAVRAVQEQRREMAN